MAEITLEQFTKSFFSLNPMGSSNEAFNAIYYCINNKQRSDGGEIEYYWLMDKYKEYITYWNNTFSKTEERFIPKDKKKKTIYEFIVEELYNNSFEIVLSFPDRDYFLFGEYTLRELKLKVEYWNKKLGDKIWKPKTTN